MTVLPTVVVKSRNPVTVLVTKWRLLLMLFWTGETALIGSAAAEDDGVSKVDDTRSSGGQELDTLEAALGR
jgi:hypothetical protein